MSHILLTPTDGGAVNDCSIGPDNNQIAWLVEDDLSDNALTLSVTDFRTKVFNAINAARNANGHPTDYVRTTNLDGTGQDRCSNAVGQNTVPASSGFASWFNNHIHDSYVQRQVDHGVSKPDHGEIAMWGDGSLSPKQVVNIYMNSPDHRAIILASSGLLQDIGVGVRYCRADDGSTTRVINVCALAGS